MKEMSPKKSDDEPNPKEMSLQDLDLIQLKMRADPKLRKEELVRLVNSSKEVQEAAFGATLKTENFNYKNKKCKDPHFNHFVSEQLNDLQEHKLKRYDYLKTHLSKAGLRRRNDYETDQILSISKKIKNFYASNKASPLETISTREHEILKMQKHKPYYLYTTDIDKHLSDSKALNQ